MRLQFFMPRHSLPDVQTTSQEWKPDPDVITKIDDLYTTAFESDPDKTFFDNDQDEPDLPNSPNQSVGSDQTNDKTFAIISTVPEICPEIPPQSDGKHHGADTDHDTSYTQDMNVEHSNHNFTNPRSKKTTHYMTQNWNAMTITDAVISVSQENFLSIS